jgi:alpha-tubulin suppressor-like RCC1 family protein
LRRWTRVGVAAVLGVEVLVVVPTVPAGATTATTPTVSHFTATPTTLYNNGGTVVLSAKVTKAESCLFSSNKSVAVLPATIPCSKGSVYLGVTLPANAGKKAVTYKFSLAVTDTKTVDAKDVKVTVETGPPPPLAGVRSVTTGALTTCALLTTGSIDCWGDDSYGEIGNGTTDGPNEGGYDTPQAVTGITDATSVASAGVSFCALLTTGSVDCWGADAYGELGNGKFNGPDCFLSGIGYCYDTPQVVTGITNARSVTSEDNGYCAVLTTGGVGCWGDNSYGELGNGTIDGPHGEEGYDKPQVVTGITDAMAVTSGGGSPCALLATGSVDCWGYNYYGELGNGTTVDSDVPVAVTGITDAMAVTSDGLDSCALLATGSVDCWGYNYYGELGNGTTGGPDGAGDASYDTPQAVLAS